MHDPSGGKIPVCLEPVAAGNKADKNSQIDQDDL